MLLNFMFQLACFPLFADQIYDAFIHICYPFEIKRWSFEFPYQWNYSFLVELVLLWFCGLFRLYILPLSVALRLWCFMVGFNCLQIMVYFFYVQIKARIPCLPSKIVLCLVSTLYQGVRHWVLFMYTQTKKQKINLLNFIL